MFSEPYLAVPRNTSKVIAHKDEVKLKLEPKGYGGFSAWCRGVRVGLYIYRGGGRMPIHLLTSQ